ncbi:MULTISPECIES: helix-turn-helix domain-containing protein [Pseudomonas]|jgi:transcriptional regulator with XRE-family HTH domain|uniref:Xre family transcriptional regulator n=2 Tax=Pseudomonas TaxID=286 RepID=A0A4R7VJ58_9PSED|nr:MULTISPECIES: helix-turn-helix transcriptional regulator [Pseudomonas]RON80770.1 transcriptional regulator [Pseudomonas fluorescens]TDV49464.1 Xre family transcriptional regulator [Pseudomonas helmanticensis]WGT36083.1 helix-turn-helix transcriptional regulator [Pseudomonas atacamensis]
MELNQAFGVALQRLRKSKALTQEDFSTVSSRTYLSTLERGLKSPTLEKVDALASVMDVQPLTLLAYAHLLRNEGLSLDGLLAHVRGELTLLVAEE